jgi:O-antigen ligase
MTTVITLGVVLTFSRGAAVGLGMLLIALVVLRMVKRQHLVAIGLALVLVFVSFPQYWTRVSTLAAVGTLTEDGGTGAVDSSLLSRATETLSAALVMVDHPLIGVGPGLFPTYYEEYAQVVGIKIKNDATREAHNLYLGLGAELGVTGLAVFLIVAILTVRMILLARRRSIERRPDLERLTTPFALSIMTYHVTGMFLHLSFARFYWLMLGGAGAAAVITLREMDATDAADATATRSQGAYSQSV